MKYLRILSFLSVLFSSGCDSQSRLWLDRARTVDMDFSAVVWLQIPKDSIGNPEMISSYGDYFLWADNRNSRPLYVYDRKSGRSYTPLRKGRASNEVLNVHRIVIDSKAGEFAVVDNFNHLMFRYRIDSAGCRRKSEVPVKDFSAVAIAGDTIVGTLSNGSARYGISLPGEQPATFGNYDAYGLSNEAGWGLMQGFVNIDERAGRLAWFGYYTAAYEIIDYRKAATIRSEVLDMSAYNNYGQIYTTLKPDSKVAFISLAACPNGLFALYDGKELSYYMNHAGSEPSGNDICFFDWDGRYLIRLHSELPIRCIAWNEEQSALYMCVLSEEGEYAFGCKKIDTNELSTQAR